MISPTILCFTGYLYKFPNVFIKIDEARDVTITLINLSGKHIKAWGGDISIKGQKFSIIDLKPSSLQCIEDFIESKISKL